MSRSDPSVSRNRSKISPVRRVAEQRRSRERTARRGRARAFYDQRRKRGDSHSKALRALSNRLASARSRRVLQAETQDGRLDRTGGLDRGCHDDGPKPGIGGTGSTQAGGFERPA